mgnify:CR=1 FL=1
MREFNLLEDYPKLDKPRMVSDKLRTIDHRIIASKRDLLSSSFKMTASGVVSGKPPLSLIITADPLLAASRLVLPNGSSHFEGTTAIADLLSILSAFL